MRVPIGVRAEKKAGINYDSICDYFDRRWRSNIEPDQKESPVDLEVRRGRMAGFLGLLGSGRWQGGLDPATADIHVPTRGQSLIVPELEGVQALSWLVTTVTGLNNSIRTTFMEASSGKLGLYDEVEQAVDFPAAKQGKVISDLENDLANIFSKGRPAWFYEHPGDPSAPAISGLTVVLQ
jgi:hypothetical protein